MNFRWASIQSSMLRIHGMMHHTGFINSLPLGKHSIHDVAPTLGIANVRWASPDSLILAAGHAFNPWWLPHSWLVTGWSCVQSPLDFNEIILDDRREDVACGGDGCCFRLHPTIVIYCDGVDPCGVMSMLNMN